MLGGDLTGFHRAWIDQNRHVRGSPIGARRDETCQVVGGADEKRDLPEGKGRGFEFDYVI
jgi:hypothetical protein